MTTIANCSNDAEAMLLKSLLEANGIQVFAPDQLDTLTGAHFAGSGLRIQVNDEDAESARKVLSEAVVAGEDDDEDEPA